MSQKISRRTALLGVSSSFLLPAGCSLPATRSDVNETFAHGVASGDPQADSVVIWTRVSGRSAPVAVDWALSTDPDFVDVVARGQQTASAARDYTVKVVAGGLAPGSVYYYRFSTGGDESIVGRTRTLPTGRLDELTFAVTSCSNYQFGYFNVYEAIAADEDIDVVVHLGDYIYEYDIETYGGPIGQRIGREHEPTHEMVSLEDYRRRHAQYKKDAGSIAMHARHPLIPTWDDHETTNNPWMDGAQNHQPEEEGSWRERRAASLKAYYEWMPVRDPAAGSAPEKLWRHFRFGDLASLITLESRHTGRSEQIVIDQDELPDAAAARRFYADVVGEPSRRMLSAELERFVGRELEESVAAGRRWRILANQTILANVVAPRLLDDPQMRAERRSMSESASRLLDWLSKFGDLELAGNMDAWDGYPAARERLYRIAAAANARDLLVVTGDTHMFWQNRLFDDSGQAMGLELGTSAVTSPRGFYELGSAAASRFDELTARSNRGVEWVDGSSRGYVRLTLGRERARADYISISNIESQRYAVRPVRTVGIARTDGTLDYA